ncbi:OmpA family protein [Amycolatopsis circi]|uniref:OmpA family protein n=1 Tax=Amycolatopsis circi TaxID=871959 RepID=UPI000E23B4BC|nr:OmpA family protein [Amycolatopsis circi]
MQRALVKAVVGAAAVVALVSACGSGGSNDSSGSGASGQNSAQSSGAAQSGQNGASGQNAASGENGAPGQNGAAGQNGPAAQAVTAAIQQASQASPIKFEPEKAELTGKAKEGLAAVAKAMQGNDVKLKVVTHAGYPDADKAKKLSEERAQAISTALESDGVAKDRVQSEPSGSENAQGDQALETQLSVA